MKRRFLAPSLLACLLIPAAVPTASADTLFISSTGTGGGTEYANVKVTKIAGDKITFQVAGRESTKDLKQVIRMKIDDEPALSAAEDAYASSDFKTAAANYQKAVIASKKDWVRDWAAVRLADAANKSGEFDKAVTAYVALVQKNPEAAAKVKPTMPDAGSTYLDTGMVQIDSALKEKLTQEQQQALLSLRLDIHMLKKDAAGAAEDAKKLQDLGGGSAAVPTKVVAETTLSLAKLDVSNKEYAKAQKAIDDNRALFTDPAQQAEALFLLAQAQQALAKDDTDKLKDAALNYMRVVAHFKDADGKPHVVESLLGAAGILEQLKDTAGATKLYQQIVNQYAEDPGAAKAKEKLAVLKPAEKPVK
ncbi:MAG TPA: hypothetical protein VIL86_05310 [Tepidisphaeraceae bacterium]|jgi:TolA-binding protein